MRPQKTTDEQNLEHNLEQDLEHSLRSLQLETGARIPTVLLPSGKTDMEKWAVIACDQYTSEPGYWEKVERLVSGTPSTLNMIYPEVYLAEGESAGNRRIASINRTMREYLANGTLEETAPGFIYAERAVNGGTAVRKGLIMAFDLEKYDFSSGSQSLIRATEGTVTERLPPRVRIRRDAVLELPHILILIDDPENSVIGPVTQAAALDGSTAGTGIVKLYDFELMLGGGRIKGYLAADKDIQLGILKALKKLAEPEIFAGKYGLAGSESGDWGNNAKSNSGKSCCCKSSAGSSISGISSCCNNSAGSDSINSNNSADGYKGILLFAVGDGNHSLATAKVCWESIKAGLQPEEIADHPARFALAELVNIHDEGIIFEPIHRILYNAGTEALIAAALQYYSSKGMKAEILRCSGEVQSYAQLKQAMQEVSSRHNDKAHVIGMAAAEGYYTMAVGNTPYNIESGTLQCFLDDFLKDLQDIGNCGISNQSTNQHQNKVNQDKANQDKANQDKANQDKVSIDYVHGSEAVDKIGRLKGNIGFFLPVPSKGSLFKTVIHEGVLPRKSFSMGEAQDKRYYLECRKIL